MVYRERHGRPPVTAGDRRWRTPRLSVSQGSAGAYLLRGILWGTGSEARPFGRGRPRKKSEESCCFARVFHVHSYGTLISAINVTVLLQERGVPMNRVLAAAGSLVARNSR